jgi:hypothetical protein
MCVHRYLYSLLFKRLLKTTADWEGPRGALCAVRIGSDARQTSALRTSLKISTKTPARKALREEDADYVASPYNGGRAYRGCAISYSGKLN